MIEKLQIRNFGTNQKQDINFSPGVTTIIGKSYVGKSWILRALRWVTLNKPAGSSFINWEADAAKVRLSIDSTKIIRTRGRYANSYKLGKQKLYTAFGNDVPADVAKIVNLGEINFQGQHEQPFWFCETAGEVSRQLNAIINLNLIDKTLANIASELRKTRIEIEVVEKSLSEAGKEKEALRYVEKMNSELADVEQTKEQYEKTLREYSLLSEKLKLEECYHQELESVQQEASDGSKVLAIGNNYLKVANCTERLSDLIRSVVTAKSKRLLLQRQVEECKEKIDEFTKGRCPLCGVKLKRTL